MRNDPIKAGKRFSQIAQIQVSDDTRWANCPAQIVPAIKKSGRHKAGRTGSAGTNGGTNRKDDDRKIGKPGVIACGAERRAVATTSVATAREPSKGVMTSQLCSDDVAKGPIGPFGKRVACCAARR